MVKSYSIADARKNLPSIVDQAESGGEVQLTRRGRPVAVVLSVPEYERLTGRRVRFRDAYRAFLAKHSLKEFGLDREFVESLRDRSEGREVEL